MRGIVQKRVTVDVDHEFVVLLIGMRVNRWWKVHKWLKVGLSMFAMVRQLKQLSANTGYLGGEYHTVGNPIVFLQYWRSYDSLERYASDRSLRHRGTWSWFFKSIGLNGDVGIYHETYRVRSGDYECVYLNMPPFGLGRIFPLVEADKGFVSSRGRMEKRREEANAPQSATHPAPQEEIT